MFFPEIVNNSIAVVCFFSSPRRFLIVTNSLICLKVKLSPFIASSNSGFFTYSGIQKTRNLFTFYCVNINILWKDIIINWMKEYYKLNYLVRYIYSLIKMENWSVE